MSKLFGIRLRTIAVLLGFALVAFGCGSQSTQLDSQPGLTLVTGITGNQGSGVASSLLEKGYAVRGITRNLDSDQAQYWASRGAEMMYGDFTDRDSMDAALVGVDYIFINLQEQVPDYINATKYLLDAADAAGVKHILYSSSRPSDPEVVGGGHKTEIEIYLRASGYSYTTLRIPQQMSSVIRDMPQLLTEGWRGRGSEDKGFAWISPDDLGPISVAAIENPEAWNGREVNLSGDELSDPELVSILRELSGLNIRYTPPPEVDERWGPAQDLSYDTEQLRAEFPMTTFREYLVENNFRENLRALASDVVEVALVDRLGDTTNADYCIDMPGGQENADPTRDLRVYTCYTDQGFVGFDHAMDAKAIAGGQFHMIGFDLCMQAQGIAAGSAIAARDCDGGNSMQRFNLLADRTIRLESAENLCLSAGDEVSYGRNGPGGHEIRSLTLEPCTGDRNSQQHWHLRTSMD